MKYVHIIWDWNGTLVDDAALCLEIINEQLIVHGKPVVTMESYRELFDFPLQGLYERLGFNFSSEPYQGVNGAFLREYNCRRVGCGLRDGVIELLEMLVKNEIGCSVLSAYSTVALRESVAQYGLCKYFKEIVGLDNTLAAGKIQEGKRLLERLGVDPSKVILVGDTTHDFAVASNLGSDCILLSGGYQSRTKLLACGVPVLDGPRMLWPYLR